MTDTPDTSSYAVNHWAAVLLRPYGSLTVSEQYALEKFIKSLLARAETAEAESDQLKAELAKSVQVLQTVRGPK